MVFRCRRTPHLLPDGVVTEEAADLSKGHGPLSPGVLPAGEVVDAQLIQVGLVQLPEEEKGGGGGGGGGARRGGRAEGRRRKGEVVSCEIVWKKVHVCMFPSPYFPSTASKRV